MWRLGDVARGTETVLRGLGGLEVVLGIRRLQRSFRIAHMTLHLVPCCDVLIQNFIKIIYFSHTFPLKQTLNHISAVHYSTYFYIN